MNNSKSDLDPWRILFSHLMDLDSYSIPGIIDRAGLKVNWALTEKENYSHKYRRDALSPRIIKMYDALSPDDQLRVSHTIAAELSKHGPLDDLNNDLKRIGWIIENNCLVPVDAEVKELFFPKGAQHDAYVEIRKIFQQASKSIFIIDPYIDSSTFTVLKTISENTIEVRLLTYKIPTDFTLETRKFLSQHNNFSVKIKRTREFHDRFLVIDDTKCWHIGCSIKDAGKKVFMISAIEDDGNRDGLIRQIESSWGSSQEEQI